MLFTKNYCLPLEWKALTILMSKVKYLAVSQIQVSLISQVTLFYQAKICWGNPQEEGKGLWNSFQQRWLSGSEGIAAGEQKETQIWCQQLPSVHERHSSHPQRQWPKMKVKFWHWPEKNRISNFKVRVLWLYCGDSLPTTQRLWIEKPISYTLARASREASASAAMALWSCWGRRTSFL